MNNRLKAFILAKSLKGEDIILYVKEFPELEKYAKHLEETARKKFAITEGTLPMFMIEEIDWFWLGEFVEYGRLGFCYDMEKRAFMFLYEGTQGIRALRFCHILRKNSYL